jgi:hypothetical protein
MSSETQESLPEDATHTDKVFFVGSRRVVLSELAVRFQAQAESANWHEVLAKLNLEVVKEDDQIHRAAFFALPERLEQFRPFLVAIVNWNEEMPGTTTWDFRWGRAEDNTPPEMLVKSSQAVGGFPKVLDRLGAVWPVTSPVKALISARYIALKDDWRFTLDPGRVKNVIAGGQKYEARPTRWTINPPSGCVSEITQHLSEPSEEDFVLQGHGTYIFQWTPRFLNEVDGAIWDGLKTFLKPRWSKARR